MDCRGPPTVHRSNENLPTKITIFRLHTPRRQGQGLAKDRSAPSSSSLFFRKFSSKFNSFCRSSCSSSSRSPKVWKIGRKSHEWNKPRCIDRIWVIYIYIDLISLFPHTWHIIFTQTLKNTVDICRIYHTKKRYSVQSGYSNTNHPTWNLWWFDTCHSQTHQLATKKNKLSIESWLFQNGILIFWGLFHNPHITG